MVGRPNVTATIDIDGNLTNAGTIRMQPPGGGFQTTLDINNGTLTNREGGMMTFAAEPGLSSFILGSVINEGELRVEEGIARLTSFRTAIR